MANKPPIRGESAAKYHAEGCLRYDYVDSPLKDVNEEKFCQTYVATNSYSLAAFEGGLAKTVDDKRRAHTLGQDFLFKHERIYDRVKKLAVGRNQSIVLDDRPKERLDSSKEGLLAYWIYSYYKLDAKGDNTNALRCLEQVGKLAGHYVEKHEDVTNPFSKLSADNLRKLVELAKIASNPITATATIALKDEAKGSAHGKDD